jgi:hypothetical protein
MPVSLSHANQQPEGIRLIIAQVDAPSGLE